MSSDRAYSGRIFIISEIFFPDDTSTGYYLTAIAERLSKRNAVVAICSRPNTALLSDKCGRLDGVHIVRVGRMTRPSTPIALRSMSATVRAVLMAAKFLWMGRGSDVALCASNPPLLALLVMIACRLRNIQCVVLIHDLYPHAAVAAGVIREGSIIATVWARLQRWMLRSADSVVCLGRDAAALITRFEPACAPRLEKICHWYDIDPGGLATKVDSEFAHRHGLQGKFVVLYAGNLGRTHDSEVIAGAAKALEGFPEIRIVVASGGSRSTAFMQSAAASGLRCLLSTSLPEGRRRQADTLAAADVILLTMKPKMGGISVPSRIYNAMAAGKPLIVAVDPESEPALVVGEEQAGWITAPTDAAALAQAILDAYGNPALVRSMGNRARAAALSKYGPDEALSHYERLITHRREAAAESRR